MVDRGTARGEIKDVRKGNRKGERKITFPRKKGLGEGQQMVTSDFSPLLLFVLDICKSLRNVHSLLGYGDHVCVCERERGGGIYSIHW